MGGVGLGKFLPVSASLPAIHRIYIPFMPTAPLRTSLIASAVSGLPQMSSSCTGHQPQCWDFGYWPSPFCLLRDPIGAFQNTKHSNKKSSHLITNITCIRHYVSIYFICCLLMMLKHLHKYIPQLASRTESHSHLLAFWLASTQRPAALQKPGNRSPMEKSEKNRKFQSKAFLGAAISNFKPSSCFLWAPLLLSSLPHNLSSNFFELLWFRGWNCRGLGGIFRLLPMHLWS